MKKKDARARTNDGMITTPNLSPIGAASSARLTYWRIAAVVLALAALALCGGVRDSRALRQSYCRVRIDGLITGDQVTLDLLVRSPVRPR